MHAKDPAHIFRGQRVLLNTVMANTFQDPLVATRLSSGNQPTSTYSKFYDAVHNILGEDVSVSKSLQHNLGAPHATTGIPYAIGGTATVIESRISAFLATFKDPLKAILGTGVHKTERIIIKRKYIAGGGAHVVPEHASARTVSIREDVREVTLTRYGTDIEMNLNLFLRPGDAKEELEMKLEAAQISLEKAMIMLGYNQVLDTGIDLTMALARSRSQTSLTDISNIYNRQIFGIMAKSAFPITSIMAAAKHANAYAIGRAAGEEKTVMILPFGTPELTKYTNPHHMEYHLSGVSMPRDKISLKVPGGMHDPVSNCVIYQHIPPINMDQGVPHPIVDTSLLANEVYIYSRVESHLFDNEDYSILNYKTGDMVKLEKFNVPGSAIKYDHTTNKIKEGLTEVTCTTANADPFVKAYNATFGNYVKEHKMDDLTDTIVNTILDGSGLISTHDALDMTEAKITAAYVTASDGGLTPKQKALLPTHYIRRTRVRMLSGILAKPGSETGELLYAYSSCSVTTNPGVEIGKLGLRSYLGAIVYNPENIFILPNIAFDDILEDVLFPFHDGTDSGHGLDSPTIELLDPEVGDAGNTPVIFETVKSGDGHTLSRSKHMNKVVPLPYKPKVIFASPEVTGESTDGISRWNNTNNDIMTSWREAFGQNEENRGTSDSYNASLNLCNCAVFNAKSETVVYNNGSMGSLDHPADIGRISGLFEYGRIERAARK